jgi:hypothetical protein
VAFGDDVVLYNYMQDYTPSPQFIKRIVYIIGVIGVIFFVARMYPAVTEKIEKITKKELIPAQTGSKPLNISLKDSDGDRLYDWEEALFGSDPTSPDTNNDGVSDYTEYKFGSDTVSDSSTDTEATTEEPKLNYTEALARDLYASILITKQQKGVVTEDDNKQLAEIATGGIAAIVPKSYARNDIIVVPDSREAKVRFTAALYQARKSYPLVYGDLVAVTKMIDSGEPIPDELIARSDRARLIVPALLQVQVPDPYSVKYINYINAVAGYTYAVSALAHNDSDPAPAFQMIKLLPSIVDELDSATVKLDSIIKSANQTR